MARFQSTRRSDEEWFKLISECRRSGLSDSLWCKQHGIPASSFFVQCTDYGKRHMRFRSVNIPLISFRIRVPVRMWYELI